MIKMNTRAFVVIISLLIIVPLAYVCLAYLSPRYLSICGLVIDMVASTILAAPLLKSLQEMAKECTSLNGFNAYLWRSMRRDRQVTLIGLLVLMIGFLFQLFSLF